MIRLFRRRRAMALAMTAVATASLAGFTAAAQTSSASTAQQSSKYGGVLNMLGSGDVDYMDPNISYYTVGYDGLRMWTEQLLQYPAIPGKTTQVVPQLATSMPTVSDNGTLYTLTIKKGVDWNTSPARQVTAADAKLGLERTCNPQQPFGGLPDFEGFIVGMTSFCSGFLKVKPTVADIKQYIDTHSISGVTVSASNPLQISYRLVHPLTYFPDLLAMAAFTPSPVEVLNYLPASAALAQHTLSDGPYEIQSYNPARSMTLVRNPVWKASLDPISKAYVNEIKIDETVSSESVQQQLQTNTSSADMEWGDTPIPPAQLPALIASHSSSVILGPTDGMDPYVVFNLKDPNENKAIQNVNVRRAISYAIDRAALVTDAGGSQVSPALSQMLVPGTLGYSDFDLYPYSLSKAKALLGGKTYTFKLLYQSDNPIEAKIFQTIQFELSVGRDHDHRRGCAVGRHLHQVLRGAEHRRAWRLGHRSLPVVPRLVRDEQRGELHRGLVRLGRVSPVGLQLQLRERHDGGLVDQPGAGRLQRLAGRVVLDPGGPPGDGGRAGVPDQHDRVRDVRPHPGAQRGVRAPDPGCGPDQRLAVAERPAEQLSAAARPPLGGRG